MSTVRFCGACGAARDASSVNFCTRCGASFAETNASSAAAPNDKAPSGVKYAGFGRRLSAVLIDLLGLTVFLFVAAVAFGIVYAKANGLTPYEGGFYAGGLFVYVWVAAPFVYFPLLWWGRLGGGTLGMRALDMRVVEATGGELLGLGRAVVRCLGLVLAVAAIFIGVLWIAFDRQSQGWHDKIAGTLVVRRS